MAQSVITRKIVAAGGVFAPGHLGELTRIIPFEMVDAVLAGCRCMQRRVRKLPARVVVYLLLAAACASAPAPSNGHCRATPTTACA